MKYSFVVLVAIFGAGMYSLIILFFTLLTQTKKNYNRTEVEKSIYFKN